MNSEIELIKDEDTIIKTTLTFNKNINRMKEYPIWIVKGEKGEFISRTPIREGLIQYLLIYGVSVTKSKELRISSVGSIGGTNVIFKDDHTIEYQSPNNRIAYKKASDIKKELGKDTLVTYSKCETVSIIEEREKCKKFLNIEDMWNDSDEKKLDKDEGNNN